MDSASGSVSLGTVVVLRGLERAVELNGRYGKVVGMRGPRILVDVEGSGVVKAVKVENCKLPRPVRAWCHACSAAISARFTETGELRCPRCSGTFVEAAVTEEQLRDASQFPASSANEAEPRRETTDMDVDSAGSPQDADRERQRANVTQDQVMEHMLATLFAPRRQVIIGRNGIVEILTPPPFSVFQANGGTGASFDNILHMLHQQDEPRGAPPASREAVERLERFKTDAAHAEHECTVCQDGYSEGEDAVKMPCGHVFHADCLTPWLKEHNSCPTCRHELPTDDSDYEARKLQEQHAQQQQQQQQQQQHVDTTHHANGARHA
ncbi:E3 ubiquitin-protein ligase RING1 [Diplonema papillatum]|nr:E3 ubiquitin-protein ligase RING1 [Diplonema papillatum]KAJ9461064.1 E3 ubiquitin-protein ligase RING1 [Diplonema papillatum]